MDGVEVVNADLAPGLYYYGIYFSDGVSNNYIGRVVVVNMSTNGRYADRLEISA